MPDTYIDGTCPLLVSFVISIQGNFLQLRGLAARLPWYGRSTLLYCRHWYNSLSTQLFETVR